MDYSFVIAIIPVILVVAFIAWIAKRITEGERIDMKEGIVGVVILMVAVLVMVPMISSTQVYTWDENNGELVIQQNITGGVYAWDTYDSQIRSIVIKPGVTQIGNSAFDGATNLEYLSIPESVTDIGTNAFGVALKDYLDQTISTPEAGDYVGAGDGELYLCEPGIFTYSTDKRTITGLDSSASGAKVLVIPSEKDNVAIRNVGDSAFLNNTTIETVFAHPDSEADLDRQCFYGCTALETVSTPNSETIGYAAFSHSSIVSITLHDGLTTLGNSVFDSCTSLTGISLPNSVTAIGQFCFRNCSALATADLSDELETIGVSAFFQSAITSLDIPEGVVDIPESMCYRCTSLGSLSLPDSLKTISKTAFFGCSSLDTELALPDGLLVLDQSAFNSCSSLSEVSIPGTVTTIGNTAFTGCTGITDVSFGSGFAATLGTNCFQAWTFYESDGTTTIDKTVAANLAGKIFSGTAAALIEVEPGRLALTPQQIQQVHLHDTELQDLKDQISIEPLPLQPSLQEQELTA